MPQQPRIDTETTTSHPAIDVNRRSVLKAAGVAGLFALGLSAASSPVAGLSLGRDRVFTTVNRARSSVDSRNDITRTTAVHSADAAEKFMTAGVEYCPQGASSSNGSYAHASLGRRFSVTGNGSRQGRISVYGHHEGDIYIKGPTDAFETANVQIRINVTDRTTGTSYSNTAFSRDLRGESDIAHHSARKAFTGVVTGVPLVAGRKYTVDTELNVSAGGEPIETPVYCGAWWHPGGRVRPNDQGGVTLDRIEVEFL